MRMNRWMLTFCILITPALLCQSGKPTAPASTSDEHIGPPAHPATEDQIREYLALTGVSRAAHTLMATMVKGMRATSAPYYPASLWDDMDAEFQKLDLVAIYVPVYQRYLSEDEMRDVIAFYHSPSGQKLLSVQGFLTRDGQEIMQTKGGEIGAAVYARHKDEIEAAKKQYESNQAKPSGAK